MKNPKLSIIIPVYNSEKTASKIINSILAQSFVDFELILVDDGSSDGTLNLLRAFSKKDKRIEVISQKNGGPSSARNAGLEKARGNYIQFFDADDDIEDDTLNTIVSNIDDSSADMLVSGWQIDLQTKRGIVKNYKTINPKANLIDSNLKEFVLRSIGNDGTLYNLWNKLFRADIINRHKLKFREDIRFGEDLIFALNYLERSKSIKIIPNVTYHYQANSDSSVFSKSSLVPEFRKINDEELVRYSSGADSDLEQWVRWRWLLSYWMMVSGSSLSRSQKIAAISDFTPKDLVVSNISGSIGIRKLFLEKIAYLALGRPNLALFIASFINFVKKSIKFIKLLLRV